jgi:osmotically inducible protein OsmC
MAITRSSEAEWKGDLKEGKGTLKLGSGAFAGQYGFKSRFENGPGTNPEELIAAAHSACYSMALSHELASNGHVPTSVKTVAKVFLEPDGGGFTITHIDLKTDAVVPGIDDATFQKFAEGAKKGCPISKALAATKINLDAKLAQ